MSLGRLTTPKSTSIFNRANAKNQAVTSISNLGREKQAPSTSIFDDHKDTKTSIFSRPTNPVTSINRPVQESSAAEADDMRYDYVRRLIKARQAKEQKEAAQKGMAITKEGKTVSITPAGEKLKMRLGTGATFHRGLRGGLDKTMKKMFRKHKYVMRNISTADRQLLGDIIAKHAANRTTGVGYGWYDKKRMKNEVQQLYESRKISKVDMLQFKKIVEELE
jgi:hypothetical protein